MTIRELYRQGLSLLLHHGLENESLDCDLLLAKALGKSTSYRHIHPNDVVLKSQEEIFLKYIQRRTEHEPLQYLLGTWSFFGRDFFVGEGVLIPRPETEDLVQCALKKISEKKNPVVYDLCAGSGAIGLTVALECPSAEVYLFEKYDAAFSYLTKNAEKFRLDNVHLLKEDVLLGCSHIIPNADVLISNPPYIESAELPLLQAEVQKEPSAALDGGKTGLDFYIAIYQKWLNKTNPDAFLFFECGENQSASILSIFKEKLTHTLVHYDFNMVDRIIEINV